MLLLPASMRKIRSKVKSLSGLKSNFSEILCLSCSFKFDEDPIKIEGTINRTGSNMIFFGTEGLVILRSIVRSGQFSNSKSFNICPIISLWENFSTLKDE